MAGRLGKKEMGKQAVVHTTVHIGETENKPGLGLAVDIKVEGIDEELLKAGHEVGKVVVGMKLGLINLYIDMPL